MKVYRSIIFLFVSLIYTAMLKAQSSPKHFVFFSHDRAAIHDSIFLMHNGINGAQITYTWKSLEPVKGSYDFSMIEEDLKFLSKRNKGLFIQLQDLTFDTRFYAVPDYIVKDSGIVKSTYSGWIPKRWEPMVAGRFHLLLKALGQQFDGRIEGLNLQEASIDVKEDEPGFSKAGYLMSIKKNMEVLISSFKKSAVILYANFMPGDSVELLAELYDYARKIKCGMGGPDIKVYRPFQMKNSYPLIRNISGVVITGMAVQEGNYSVQNPKTQRQVTVPEILDFATNYLKLSYIFWCKEEPYYSKEVLPLLNTVKHSK